MSTKNIVRNTGADLTFTYDGIDYTLPGGGDTTMLPEGSAVHAQRTYFHLGVQIVDAEHESAARDAAARKDELEAMDPAERVRNAAAEFEAALTHKDGPVCEGYPEVIPGTPGTVRCKTRTKNPSRLCQNCEPETARRDKAEKAAAAAEVKAEEVKEQLDAAHVAKVAENEKSDQAGTSTDAGATGAAKAPKTKKAAKKATAKKK